MPEAPAATGVLPEGEIADDSIISPMLAKLTELMPKQPDEKKDEANPPPPPKKDDAPPAPKKDDAPPPPPAPDDIELKNASPKAKEAFNLIKKDRDTFKGQAVEKDKTIAKLTADLAAAKGAQDIKAHPEYAALAKERDELDARLRIASVERHPKFQAHFTKAFGDAANLAKDAVGKDNAAKVEKILQMPDGEARQDALEAMAAELSPLKQGQLANALTDWRRAEAEKNSELARAGESFEKLQADEKARGENASKQNLEKRQAVAATALKIASGFDAFKTIEGDDAHNAEIAGNEAFVKSFFLGKVPDNILPSIPVMVVEGMHMKNKVIPALKSDIERLNKVIEGYTKGSPGLPKGGDTKPAPAGNPSTKNVDGTQKTFLQVYEENAPKN